MEIRIGRIFGSMQMALEIDGMGMLVAKHHDHDFDVVHLTRRNLHDLMKVIMKELETDDETKGYMAGHKQCNFG